jgi:glycosyltransferase involved in cell wall biosynthesis
VPRIVVFVVAYNAESTLERVLDRIPAAFAARLDTVLVFDDASHDNTYEVGRHYREVHPEMPLVVERHPSNLGYGGNQKAGYRWCIEHGADIVVLLHGDAQYAPEELARMVAPIEAGEAELVMGSRMLRRGGALRGGMPLYKFVGNKILTFAQNRLTGVRLSEWHSGYRAFRVSALASVPFESNSDVFDFDTQIILQFIGAGHRIVEVDIPTFYGDEISYVNGLVYAKDIMRHTLRHRRGRRQAGTATAVAGAGGGDDASTAGGP